MLREGGREGSRKRRCLTSSERRQQHGTQRSDWSRSTAVSMSGAAQKADLFSSRCPPSHHILLATVTALASQIRHEYPHSNVAELSGGHKTSSVQPEQPCDCAAFMLCFIAPTFKQTRLSSKVGFNNVSIVIGFSGNDSSSSKRRGLTVNVCRAQEGNLSRAEFSQEVKAGEGRLDKHQVLCSIYSRAIKEGSGHNGGLEQERVGRRHAHTHPRVNITHTGNVHLQCFQV